MFTRQDYMNSPLEDRAATHRKYYAQFVNARTIAFVANWIGEDALRNSKDGHFNDIQLQQWDAMKGILPMAARMEPYGDYLTLGGIVCIAKEAARQWLEQQPKA